MLRRGDTVMLHGDIGAGKTVFAGGIALALGVREPVTSPTYTFSNTYAGAIEQDGARNSGCAGSASGAGSAGGGAGSACDASGAGGASDAACVVGTVCAGVAACAGNARDAVCAGGGGGHGQSGQGAGAALCHFDVYRLDDPDGAVEIGLADSMGDPGGVTVVEWAENILPYYPSSYYDVFISKTEDWNDDRRIAVWHVGRGSGGQH
jgi:tRNA A37 threonylcarbamoyladenosine biosynthesis protein TsaE